MPHTDIAALEPALDLAVELGAGSVLTVGHDSDWSRMAANLGRLCDAAHARALRVMLEFIPYSHVRTLAQAHKLLTEAAPANAGLLVDAIHLSRSGGDPTDIAQYDPALFSYVHLCDALPAQPSPQDLRSEARGGRLYPGEGGLWLPEFVAAFPPPRVRPSQSRLPAPSMPTCPRRTARSVPLQRQGAYSRLGKACSTCELALSSQM